MTTTSSREHARMGTAEERQWQAVRRRDAAFDGTFCYAVQTTGIYCRPSCPARRPRRENVRFYPTGRDAEAAGFRPCRRCRPDASALAETHAAKVAAACRLIETAEEPPRLRDLAGASGLSPYHFHRVFKAIAGVTPKAYALAHRRNLIQDTLQSSGTVTEAIHDAGFNSTGRFYSHSNETLGMTPTDFRAGGKNTAIRFAVGQCSLGAILVAASEKGVAAILLGDEPAALVRDLETRFPSATLIGADPAFEETVAKVVGFVEAPGTGLDLPLDIQGTAFQQRVWQALRRIRPGTTATYGDIAEAIGRPTAARAVATACAANPIAVAIPCHRVVRTGGAISGYRWGIARKRALLARESEAGTPRSNRLQKKQKVGDGPN